MFALPHAGPTTYIEGVPQHITIYDSYPLSSRVARHLGSESTQWNHHFTPVATPAMPSALTNNPLLRQDGCTIEGASVLVDDPINHRSTPCAGEVHAPDFSTGSSSDSKHGQKNPILNFVFNGHPGVPLSLALEDSSALQGLSDPDDHSFLDKFGEKVTYKIILHENQPYKKQKRCRRVKRGVYSYLTTADIVRQVAEVMKQLLDTSTTHYQPIPIYEGFEPSAQGHTLDRAMPLENIVLLELRKVSKATLQPIFGCR